MNNEDIHISKTLSWLLRHAALKEGLNISSDGFVNVNELLEHRCFKNKVTFEDIQRVVSSNDKQRYVLKTDQDGILMIGANQGHSIKVITDLNLELIYDSTSVPNVIHGTFYKNWDSIKKNGLNRVNRLHIHFTTGLPTDQNVISGMRKNCDVYIYINLQKALADNLKFFKSKNGVILSPGNENGILEVKYFSKVIDAKTGRILI